MKVLESHNIEFLGHTDLDGKGDGMQIMRKGDYIYVGHMGYNGIGTSVVDVSDPSKPRVVRQLPIPENTHSHKVQLAGDILLINHEQQLRAGTPYSSGLAVYDVSKADDPKQIGWLPIKGQGVHRMWWTGDKYAYFSVREEGYRGRFMMVADVSDPEQPRVHSRWWYPGQWEAGGEVLQEHMGAHYRAHHVIVKGDRAYGGYGDGGLVIFSVDDGHLELISQRSWTEEIGGGTHTHTGLPLLSHNLVVTTDEPMKEYCDEAKKVVRVFDISDDRNPQQIGTFKEPEGNFCERGGRYGPHNFHENRPDTFVSEDILFLTYFNAGLRVYNVSDRNNIREIARFIPDAPSEQKAAQINDVLVSADGTIYASDRIAGGVYILRLTEDAQ